MAPFSTTSKSYYLISLKLIKVIMHNFAISNLANKYFETGLIIQNHKTEIIFSFK